MWVRRSWLAEEKAVMCLLTYVLSDPEPRETDCTVVEPKDWSVIAVMRVEVDFNTVWINQSDRHQLWQPHLHSLPNSSLLLQMGLRLLQRATSQQTDQSQRDHLHRNNAGHNQIAPSLYVSLSLHLLTFLLFRAMRVCLLMSQDVMSAVSLSTR